MATRRIPVVLLACTLATLTVASSAIAAVPPANDDFSAATNVAALPFQDTVDTTEATLEVDEPQPPCTFFTGRTVWYSFTPGSDTIVSVDTLGSGFDTVLAVWTGSQLDSLELVACNDDALSLGAQVPFRAQAGTTYYVQAGGFDEDGGSLVLRMREIQAAVIEGTVTVDGTGAPIGGICVDAIDRDLFSVQTAVTRADGTYEVVVRGGSYLVSFLDFCDRSDDYIGEWYDDVPFGEPENASPVDVATGDVESGIDAELAPGCPGVATIADMFGFNQVVGTAAPDTLVGTSGDDVLCGLAGGDTLRGMGGVDVLFGGKGRDRIIGGPGDDQAIGGPGKDELLGGSGEDFLVGSRGNDRLRGGRGNDLLFGGRGRDVCGGGPGIDVARGCEVTRSVVRSRSRVIIRRASASSVTAAWDRLRTSDAALAHLRS